MTGLLTLGPATAAGASPLDVADLGPGTLVVALALLSLLPFALMMTTSFLKFAVVLSILRTALGTQQTPPNMVLLGLAGVLTLHVMAPVGTEIVNAARAADERAATERRTERRAGDAPDESPVVRYLQAAREPLRDFLRRHAHPDDVAMFYGQALARAERAALRAEGGAAAAEARGVTTGTRPARTGPAHDPSVPSFDGGPMDLSDPAVPAPPPTPREDDLLVLVPAFVLSELSEAFAIGFLLFLPFLVIDLVVGNILLAMGMHMLSPVVVSLPFKLLLFVMLDGWRLVVEGMVQPYLF